MKKVNIYNIAFVCLAFIGVGALTAFDGAETDEQKIDNAYNALVTTFKAEQDSLCKVAALAAAEAQMSAAPIEETVDAGDAPAVKPTTKKKPKSGSTSGTTTQPTTTTTTTTTAGGSTEPTTPKGGKLNTSNSKEDGGGKLNTSNSTKNGGKLNTKNTNTGSGSGKLNTKK